MPLTDVKIRNIKPSDKTRKLFDGAGLYLLVTPAIGSRPIAELKAFDLLPILRRVEARGAHELARRVRQILGGVFRYAVATGRAERDWPADLRDALEQKAEQQYGANSIWAMRPGAFLPSE